MQSPDKSDPNIKALENFYREKQAKAKIIETIEKETDDTKQIATSTFTDFQRSFPLSDEQIG